MSDYTPTNPLIVQGDHSVLVEVDSPRYEEDGAGFSNRSRSAWPH